MVHNEDERVMVEWFIREMKVMVEWFVMKMKE